MAGGWRYIAQRLAGPGAGDFLDFDVPLSSVEITRELSGPGRLTATITPEVGRMLAGDGKLLLEEWGTAIYPEVDGKIRGGFIVVSSSFEGASWQLDCVGFAGYPGGMPYTGSIFFVEADPLDIVRHIWQHLQGQPNGNLNVKVDGTRSPVRIGTQLEQVEFDSQHGPASFEAGPRKLTWYQTDDLGREIDDLAKLTPFDYSEEHDWHTGGGTVIEHRIRLHYPTMGRRRDDLRFMIGENVHVTPTLERNGDEYANEVLALGAGEGRDMVHASTSRPDGRLRRVAVVTDKQRRTVRDAAVLAQRELANRLGLDEVTSITVLNHPHAPYGSYDIGDEILIQGDLGWVDVNLWVRILSSTISPDEGQTATLTVARTDTVMS